MQCAVCKSNFTSSSGLDAHVNDSHRAMGFITIGNMFTQANLPIPLSVARHLNANIKCDMCGLSFTHIGSRNRHVKSVHNKCEPIKCAHCDLVFTCSSNLVRHVKSVHVKDIEIRCSKCSKEFSRQDTLQLHIPNCTAKKACQYNKNSTNAEYKIPEQATSDITHVKESKLKAGQGSTWHKVKRNGTFRCQNCSRIFPNKYALLSHRRKCHPDAIPDIPPQLTTTTCKVEVESSSLNNYHRRIQFTPTTLCVTIDQLKDCLNTTLVNTIEYIIHNGKEVKVSFDLFCDTHQLKNGVVGDLNTWHFPQSSVEIQDGDVEQIVNTMFTNYENMIDVYETRISGWIVSKINCLTMAVTRYKKLYGAKGGMKVQIPPILQNKKCIINIECPPDLCFKYAVLSSIHYQDVKDNRERASSYKVFDSLYNWSTINFPVSVTQFKLFCEANPNVGLSALKWNNTSIPDHIYSTPQDKKPSKTALLLLFDNHWLGINPQRLGGLFRRPGKKDHAICHLCLHNFYTQELLAKHACNCMGDLTVVKMPRDNCYGFQDHDKILAQPYCMYIDIEAILEEQEPNKGLTKRLQKHIPIAIGSLLIASDDLKASPITETNVYKNFTGSDCIREFRNYLHETTKSIYNWTNINSHVLADRSRPEDNEMFDKADRCWQCKRAFKGDKVWHHNHNNGQFISALCSGCNLKIVQSRRSLTIVCHNLKNYDLHHILLNGLAEDKRITLRPIAQTSEKYIGLTASYYFPIDHTWSNDANIKNKKTSVRFDIRFIDSCAFMPNSLDNLVQTLSRNSLTNTFNMMKTYRNLNEDTIVKKGVFPYSYLNTVEKLKETMLPQREAFYDALTQTDISDDDYDHAKISWTGFECKTFGDYMERYLELDVRLLADVFENFRKLTMTEDNLDAAHFLTISQLSYASAFKMINKDVSLLTREDEYKFFEDSIRGGMCFVNKHICTSGGNVELAYVDANNLYGQALSMKLPVHCYDWLSPEEYNSIDWCTIDTDGHIGYFLEVDLEYPHEIHENTADLPFAPLNQKISYEMMTPFMKLSYETLCTERGLKGYQAESKLLLTQENKYYYKIHFALLKFYLNHGMKLLNIHRVKQFEQEAIFKPYIEYNNLKRQQATTDFEKAFYKQKNNSIYGKTMENVRKRQDYRLVTSYKRLVKLASKRNFFSANSFNANLVGVKMIPKDVLLNKPIYIGAAVLDLSKLIMYQYRYDNFTKYEQKFGGTIRIVAADTDSFFLECTNISVYNQLYPEMLKDRILDTSNFPNEHILYTTEFKAQFGKLKDECGGLCLLECIFLKPKCYSFIVDGGHEVHKAKGVQRRQVKHMKHSEYKSVYETQCSIMKKIRRITSEKHQLFTIEQEKWALCAMDNKRAWLDNNRSVPYGNYILRKRLPDDMDNSYDNISKQQRTGCNTDQVFIN